MGRLAELGRFALRPVGGLILFCAGFLVVFLAGARAVQWVVAPLCSAQAVLNESTPCQLVFVAPQEAFFLIVQLASLGGFLLALPALIVLVARLIAPAMMRARPEGAVPFALAGGILAVLGAAYAISIEAPGAFLPLLEQLRDMLGEDAPFFGLSDYARATIYMAFAYALTLQIPVFVLMMIKSWRTRRALNAEGTA